MAKDSEVLDGTQGTAKPEGSDDKTGQRGSVATDADLAKQLATLQKQFDQLQRGLQSDKDRAVKQTNQRLDVLEGDIRSVLQVAQREGKNVGDILTELDDAEERETRQLMKELALSFRDGKLQQGARQSPQSGVDVSAVLTELELDAEDVRVQEFRSRAFTSEAEAYREGAKLLKKIQSTQPSDADKTSDVAGTRRPAGKQEDLMREYQEGSKALYGRDLILFKQRMREKGLEIS